MNTPKNNETTTVAACPPLSGGLGTDIQRAAYEFARDKDLLGANHLGKLCDELTELLNNPDDPMEMADVFLALLLHAEQGGVDLIEAARKKLEIVKLRTYGEPDERGVVRHI